MHAIAITPEAYRNFRPALDLMHQLRARVFHERLGWDVEVVDGREFDEFDNFKPTYVLAISEDDSVAGSVRLLPAMGPTLLSVLFPELCSSGLFCPHTAMIESSRFCVDTTIDAKRGGQGIHDATWTLFSGIIEWSMANGYSELITVTDVRIERILRRAGWPMARIGQPKTIGNTTAVVGLLPTDQPSFECVRPDGYSSEIRSLARAA